MVVLYEREADIINKLAATHLRGSSLKFAHHQMV